MVFENTQMFGIDFAFPDVCLTPVVVPVPIPYPNLGMRPMHIPSQFRTFTLCMPVHNLAGMEPMSLGDQPGVALGVASGLVMGPDRNIMGSFRVFTGGPPVTKMLSPSLHNSTNMVGLTLAPSQVRTMVLA